MEKIDFLLVGDGFASLFFAHQLIKNNQSFKLFSSGNKAASQVSAGIVNPVVLKRFSPFDDALTQINHLKSILNEIEIYLGTHFWIDEPVSRIFHDELEVTLWQKKSNQPNLVDFLDKDITHFPKIKNPKGVGTVMHSGRLDVETFFKHYFEYFKTNHQFVNEYFDYQLLDVENNQYKHFNYKYIVFAEGYRVKDNPYFSHTPIIPNKGHCFHLKIEDLKMERTLKKKHFLFPIATDMYYYGGTYDRENANEVLDNTALIELENGYKEICDLKTEITEKNFAFRPTVADRRPILGKHPQYTNLFIFNGLGARGVLNASFYSSLLFDFIYRGKPLPKEVNIDRFANFNG